MKNAKKAPAILLLLMLWALIAVTPAHAAERSAGDDPMPMGNTQSGLKADPRDNPFYVPPPVEMLMPGPQPRRADSIQIIVNRNPPRSCPPVYPGFSDGKLVSWDVYPEAAQAFDYAKQIWSTLLNGPRPVTVDACLYSKLPDDMLGLASPSNWYTNIAAAPRQDTSYPIALANQFINQDLNGTDVPEIGASFSMDYSWYFGTDGNVPLGKRDFVTVVLHELGHGLGFSGSADFDNGISPAECGGTGGTGCVSKPPRAYDRLIEAGNKSVVEGFVSPSVALGDALTGGDLFINGTAANAANANSRPKVYAPRPWEAGSSYSHLDDGVYDNTVNALMTHDLALREAIHHPGPITLGIFADEGWSVNSRSQVYVNWSHVGFEDGTAANPFNTVRAGMQAVLSGGTVWISSGNYPERLTFNRPMLLKTTDGAVTIGK